MKTLMRASILAFCLILNVSSLSALTGSGYCNFPRLLGMNIGAKNYDDPQYYSKMAKFDVVILGFYPGWHGSPPAAIKIRDLVKVLKRIHPGILVGQYTVLNEAYAYNANRAASNYKAIKLDEQNWWLKDAEGKKVQWSTEWKAWDINISNWTRPDAEGRRYSEWLAESDFRMFFDSVAEFDIWYVDNVFGTTRVVQADWKQNGVNMGKNDPEVVHAYRDGHVRHWQAIRKLSPDILLVGNTTGDLLTIPEFSNKLNGVFLEGNMGYGWSIEKQHDWKSMMDSYATAMKNTLLPHIVGFNVRGDIQDYRFFRYAFTSCLMEDGYFSFTDEKVGYSSVPWFEEYDISLGKAVDPPSRAPWQGNVYMRKFEKGMALVNPGPGTATFDLPEGYSKFKGSQDRKVNNGEASGMISLPPKDGIVLIGVKQGRSPAEVAE